MPSLKFSTRSISITALALSFITLISTNIYFASSSSNEISGCVNKKTGLLRIAVKCNTSEKLISWNKFGPQGEQGLKGETGTAGIQGEVGLPGERGPIGIQGPQGIQGPKGDTGPQGGTTVVTQTQIVSQKVYDANGLLMGDLLGSSANDITVQVSGSRFTYLNTGFIYLNGEVIYSDSNCSGTKYAQIYLGEVSNWPLSTPFVTVAGIDPRRSVAGFFVGTSTGGLVPIPTPAYETRFNGSGVLVCSAMDTRYISELSGMVQLTPLNLNVPVSYATPFSIRSS